MNSFVVDVSQDDFERIVLQGSQQQPVLVDFWADWCAPCKQLTPVLESLADEYQGAFLLAKVDTEANQMLAAQVGVRSMPTVLLVKDGQVLDHFMGALPEGEVRAFLEKHVEKPALNGLELARELADDGDLEGAIEAFNALLEADPENHDAFVELASVLDMNGQSDEAQAICERLPDSHADHPIVQRLKAQAQLQSLVGDAPTLLECQAQLDADPANLDARYFLAARQAQSGQLEQAISGLLDMVSQHREYRDDGARTLLLKLFELLGKDHPAVRQGRRQLATLLN